MMAKTSYKGPSGKYYWNYIFLYFIIWK
jgi:hypothetical protein